MPMNTRSRFLINVCTRRFPSRGDEEVWSEMKRARKAQCALTKQFKSRVGMEGRGTKEEDYLTSCTNVIFSAWEMT